MPDPETTFHYDQAFAERIHDPVARNSDEFLNDPRVVKYFEQLDAEAEAEESARCTRIGNRLGKMPGMFLAWVLVLVVAVIAFFALDAYLDTTSMDVERKLQIETWALIPVFPLLAVITFAFLKVKHALITLGIVVLVLACALAMYAGLLAGVAHFY